MLAVVAAVGHTWVIQVNDLAGARLVILTRTAATAGTRVATHLEFRISNL